MLDRVHAANKGSYVKRKERPFFSKHVLISGSARKRSKD
jgi:hypothetical protein